MKRLSFLLAVLLLVASVPVAATTTPGDEVTYKRVSVWDTDFGQQVKACVDAYVDTYTGIGEAMYDVYLGFFNGFTDKNGVVHDPVAPVTDDRGYAWYPIDFGSASVDYATSSKTGSLHYAGNHVDIDFDYRDTSNSSMTLALYKDNVFPNNVTFVAPVSGSYSIVYLGYSSGWTYIRANPLSSLTRSGSNFIFTSNPVSIAKGQIGYAQCTLETNSLDSSKFERYRFDVQVWAKLVDSPSGSGFSGFGGGATRGAGAGRKLDLVSASKVSAGTGISRSDIFEQYAIFDEATKTVNIPQDDGTTVTKTAESWVYDYPTRTYTITTPTNETVKVVYAEDKVSVTDSSNTPKEYYYAEPEPLPTTTPSESTTSPGGGTTTAPDDSGGGGSIFGIFGWLKDLVNGIFGGIGDLFSTITAAFNSIASFGSGFANLISHYFSYIPSEIAALIVLSFSALVLMRIFGR